ncbi:MAG: hypothetical protein IJH32_11740 [Ruminococcus sp.]|nr:hypothetical protein [Ruminococcus sp.]
MASPRAHVYYNGRLFFVKALLRSCKKVGVLAPTLSALDDGSLSFQPISLSIVPQFLRCLTLHTCREVIPKMYDEKPMMD